MTFDRLIYDDLVIDHEPADPKTVADTLDFLDTILGPRRMTCLTHGRECPMRLLSCTIAVTVGPP